MDYPLLLCTRYTSRVRGQQENCNGCVTEVLLEEAFGERLKRLRRARAARLNEETRPVDVAKAVGVTRAAYTNWEMGIRLPKNVGYYRRLAAYFEIEIVELGVNLDTMAPEQPVMPKPSSAIKKVAKRHYTRTGAARKRQKGSE